MISRYGLQQLTFSPHPIRCLKSYPPVPPTNVALGRPYFVHADPYTQIARLENWPATRVLRVMVMFLFPALDCKSQLLNFPATVSFDVQPAPEISRSAVHPTLVVHAITTRTPVTILLATKQPTNNKNLNSCLTSPRCTQDKTFVPKVHARIEANTTGLLRCPIAFALCSNAVLCLASSHLPTMVASIKLHSGCSSPATTFTRRSLRISGFFVSQEAVFKASRSKYEQIIHLCAQMYGRIQFNASSFRTLRSIHC